MKMKRKLLLLLAGLAVFGCGTALAAEADGHPDNFYKSDKVTVQNVDFNNQYKMKVAGHLFTPKVKNANNGAAVIVGHPMGAVKEQSADLYATKLAEQGFTTLSIDLSFWGGSEGQPRNAVSPDIYAEDFSAAVDYLGTSGLVDRERIGALGICGSGIIDIISELYRCGIVNAKGLFIREGERVRRDHHGMGRYVIAFENESETGREVSINEVDIDNFIRAKGAIFSAIATLLQSVDMPVEAIENVYVAGGIGSGINMKNAVNIGMFPDVELEKFHYIGNSSLAGAYAMVMSDEAAAKTAEVAANMTYLELSTYPGYMDSFVAACFLPHTDSSLFPTVMGQL